jgi:hypothetical protein
MYTKTHAFCRPKEDEPEQTVMIKPSAFMRLLSGGNDVSGKMVKLTDSVTLRIELHYQYRSMLCFVCDVYVYTYVHSIMQLPQYVFTNFNLVVCCVL